MAEDIDIGLTDEEIDLFFESTGLKFDPMPAVGKKLSKIFEEATGTKIKELESSGGSGMSIRGRVTLEVLKKVEEGRKKVKYKYCAALANKKKKIEVEKLQKIISSYKAAGLLEVTKKTISDYTTITKLSNGTVKGEYEKNGFKITAEDEFYPKFPAQKEAIEKALEDLRNAKDRDSSALPTSGIRDLYAFAAYLSGSDPGKNVEVFRQQSAGDLFKLFDGKSLELSQRNDDFGKAIVGVNSRAKLVFDSEDHRREYDDWLLYNSPKLNELFNKLKSSDPIVLKKDDIAGKYIRQIAELFPAGDNSYDTALAIYRKEAGCDDYVPVNHRCLIVCAACNKMSEFESFDDAKKENACQGCGKTLFRKCDKCGEMVRVTDKKCPDCDYVFPDPKLFEQHCNDARIALQKGEFLNARNYLKLAREAYPKGVGADEILKRIEEGEVAAETVKSRREAADAYARLEERLKKNNVITKEDVDICVRYKKEEPRFAVVLDEHRAKMDEALKLKKFEEVERYLRILDSVLTGDEKKKYKDLIEEHYLQKKLSIMIDNLEKDFISHNSDSDHDYRISRIKSDCLPLYKKTNDGRLLDLIMKTRPLPPKGLSAKATVDGVRLKWVRRFNDDALIHILRKPDSPFTDSDKMEQHRKDFCIVSIDDSKGEYADAGTQGGRTYYYAAFAERKEFEGCVSGVSESVRVSTNIGVSGLSIRLNNNKVELAFTKPSFCHHVKIERRLKDSQSSIELLDDDYEGKSPYMVEKETDMGKPYVYRLTCIYEADRGKWIESACQETEEFCIEDKRKEIKKPDRMIGFDRASTRIDSNGCLRIGMNGCPPAGTTTVYFNIRIGEEKTFAEEESEKGQMIEGNAEKFKSEMKWMRADEYNPSAQYSYHLSLGKRDAVCVTLITEHEDHGCISFYNNDVIVLKPKRSFRLFG